MLSLHQKLQPLNELDDYEYQQLVSNSETVRFSRETTLKSDDYRNWFVYLLEGEISSVDKTDHQHFIIANDERCNKPLFGGKSGFKQITASTDIVIIKYDVHRYDMLKQGTEPGMENVDSVAFDNVESEIFEIIFTAYSQKEIALPSLPDIATKVRKAIENENVQIDDIVRIIEADPALVAQLLKLANSAFMRPRDPITSIKDAIVRIGLKSTRDYVLLFTIKNLFQTSSKTMHLLMKKFYQHSVQVSAMCMAIAQLSGKLNPEQALLAGLLHDIGVIPILNYANELGASSEIEEEIEQVTEKLKSIVGSMLLRQWGLEEAFIDCAEHAQQWLQNNGDELNYCDLVIIAQLHPIMRSQTPGSLPALEDTPAFQKINLINDDQSLSQQIVDIAHEQIAEIMSLLHM